MTVSKEKPVKIGHNTPIIPFHKLDTFSGISGVDSVKVLWEISSPN